MGKIYRAPDYIDLPDVDYKNFDYREYDKKVDEYIRKVKHWAWVNGRGKYAGKMIQFRVADGYAMYVVFSLRPIQLIHLNIGDGYQFDYAHRLSIADIKDLIHRQELAEDLFSCKTSTKENTQNVEQTDA